MIKRGDSQKHTQRVQRSAWSPGPGSQQLFENSSRILSKSQKRNRFSRGRKICNGKTKGFYTFLCFLHFGTGILSKSQNLLRFQVDAKFATVKQTVFSHSWTLTMDTCNRHLQWTLTVDTKVTYNRHSQ